MASVAQDHGAAVPALGPIGTRQGDSDHRVRKMPAKATQLSCVYDAGPWGDWLSRYRRKKGSDGGGVAPSLLPQNPGERVTTDRREAIPRARLARSGDRPLVSVPQGAAEAMRALTRARDDALRDLQAATRRLQAFLLRHAMREVGRAHGGPAHLRWLSAVVWPTPAPQSVVPAYVRAVPEPPARLPRRAQARHEHVQAWRVSPVIAALQALRGVPGPVAVTLGAAMGALPRFDRPRDRRKSLGWMPAASASGAPRRQGAMTQAGNTQACRVLVAGAWADRYPAQVSRPLQRRLDKQPKVIQDSRGKAQVRWCQRSRRRVARGQPAHGVTGAMARELLGFLGAMAQAGPVGA